MNYECQVPGGAGDAEDSPARPRPRGPRENTNFRLAPLRDPGARALLRLVGFVVSGVALAIGCGSDPPRQQPYPGQYPQQGYPQQGYPQQGYPQQQPPMQQPPMQQPPAQQPPPAQPQPSAPFAWPTAFPSALPSTLPPLPSTFPTTIPGLTPPPK